MALTNAEIAEMLRANADLMEIAGENSFRVNAFRRAADAVRDHDRALTAEADLTDIPGVGAGIAAVLREILATGTFGSFEELQEQLPGSLLALLDIPGVGAKTAARLYRELNVTSLTDLEEALRSGRLATMKGMGPKAQARIAEGLVFVQRRSGRTSIGMALPLAERLAGRLVDITGQPVYVAGSVRRMCVTVGNLDLVAVGEDVEAVLNAAGGLPDVARETSREDDFATFELHQGVMLRVRATTAERAGTALIEMTGSAAHLQQLRQHRELPTAATEEKCYAALGLPFIAPELREDRGELQAAREGRLPRLIEVADLRGDLHLHTTWSDGGATPLEMALAAGARGYEYLGITDHSGGLGIAGGLRPERLAEQRIEIDSLRDRSPVRLLAGSEVEVHRDGRLDFDDAILAGLDIVVASLHSGLRQPSVEFTDRLCSTIRNSNVDIIAHPTGRLVERRQGADIDWPRVFTAALETATVLEINGDPARLDMDDEPARAAFEAGCLISIDSDAHHTESLGLVRYGVGVARRAWIEPQRVVNTWPLDDLLAWLRDRTIKA
ncbi:MAG TPA: DNA polymerase/3'-5' exonuclease PolX [Thermomicrobiales bacterium]|nr:DNA polymerase/3'-5' exonuclease PolX [Thermomicrobiales bacterium]